MRNQGCNLDGLGRSIERNGLRSIRAIEDPLPVREGVGGEHEFFEGVLEEAPVRASLGQVKERINRSRAEVVVRIIDGVELGTEVKESPAATKIENVLGALDEEGHVAERCARAGEPIVAAN